MCESHYLGLQIKSTCVLSWRETTRKGSIRYIILYVYYYICKVGVGLCAFVKLCETPDLICLAFFLRISSVVSSWENIRSAIQSEHCI